MMGLLRELPDWSVGVLLGGAAWFAVSYIFLAPRALTGELESEIYPACFAKLEADQDRAIERATTDALTKAKYMKESLLREIKTHEADIQAMEQKLFFYEELKRIYDETDLGAFMPLPNIGVSSSSLKAKKLAIEALIEKLDQPFNVVFPRAPSADLVKTCACAAAQAIAGQQMNYAVSMASFRLLSPTDISSVKQTVAENLNMNSCGIPNWKNFS
jgi:hypothetical protein